MQRGRRAALPVSYHRTGHLMSQFHPRRPSLASARQAPRSLRRLCAQRAQSARWQRHREAL